jgi:hypothetical protein
MKSYFINDNNVANCLNLSPSWVRKQRHLRRHGHDHVFTVDPILIGDSPRYRIEDFETWVNGLDVGGVS